MKNKKQFFVTGIDTDVGKTLISAALVRLLKADYWKPLQTGASSIEDIDSSTVSEFSLPNTRLFPETHLLKSPVSPHQAAAEEKRTILLSHFKLPDTENPLIVEGAGGVMCPINDTETMLDLIKHLKLPCIVVAKNYLGSINHTALTLSLLNFHKISIEGIIWNGDKQPWSEQFILDKFQLKEIGRLDYCKELTGKQLDNCSAKWNI